MLGVFSIQTNADDNTKENNGLTLDYILNAELNIEDNGIDNPIIVLSQNKIISSCYGITNYEVKNISIITDSKEQFEKVLLGINDTKALYATNAGGTATDGDWFHGMSLYISSTIAYSTFNARGLKWGKINSVTVDCSMLNSTVLDSLSLTIHQYGYYYEGSGRITNETTQDILNHSTTLTPLTWNNIYWAQGIESLVGAKVVAKVHRGASSQYTYSFSNTIIE